MGFLERVVMAVCLVAVSWACGPATRMVQGERLYAERWAADVAELTRRAQFDFECDETPRMRLLRAQVSSATAVGVLLCGHRGTYTRDIDALYNPGTWFLNARQEQVEPRGAQ